MPARQNTGVKYMPPFYLTLQLNACCLTPKIANATDVVKLFNNATTSCGETVNVLSALIALQSMRYEQY